MSEEAFFLEAENEYCLWMSYDLQNLMTHFDCMNWNDLWEVLCVISVAIRFFESFRIIWGSSSINH